MVHDAGAAAPVLAPEPRVEPLLPFDAPEPASDVNIPTVSCPLQPASPRRRPTAPRRTTERSGDMKSLPPRECRQPSRIMIRFRRVLVSHEALDVQAMRGAGEIANEVLGAIASFRVSVQSRQSFDGDDLALLSESPGWKARCVLFGEIQCTRWV